VVSAVMENLADFGITQLPIEEKKIQIVKIHSDEIKLLIPAGHRMADRASVTCSDLVGEPLLIPKSGTTRTRLNAWLEPVEDEINVSMELDSTEMIKQFVMAGLGLSFLAASHCEQEVRQGRLSVASLAPEPMIRRLALIYRKDKNLSKAALGFIEAVIEHAGGERLAQVSARAPKVAAG
jgi:DNA-binding transcriptional LysR family regulator